MPQIISATDAKNRFSEIVNRVLYSGEEFIVQKQGKPVIKIIPLDKREKNEKKIDPGTQFLLKLAKINAKNLPADLGKNHDKYAWD